MTRLITPGVTPMTPASQDATRVNQLMQVAAGVGATNRFLVGEKRRREGKEEAIKARDDQRDMRLARNDAAVAGSQLAADIAAGKVTPGEDLDAWATEYAGSHAGTDKGEAYTAEFAAQLRTTAASLGSHYAQSQVHEEETRANVADRALGTRGALAQRELLMSSIAVGELVVPDDPAQWPAWYESQLQEAFKRIEQDGTYPNVSDEFRETFSQHFMTDLVQIAGGVHREQLTAQTQQEAGDTATHLLALNTTDELNTVMGSWVANHPELSEEEHYAPLLRALETAALQGNQEKFDLYKSAFGDNAALWSIRRERAGNTLEATLKGQANDLANASIDGIIAFLNDDASSNLIYKQIDALRDEDIIDEAQVRTLRKSVFTRDRDDSLNALRLRVTRRQYETPVEMMTELNRLADLDDSEPSHISAGELQNLTWQIQNVAVVDARTDELHSAISDLNAPPPITTEADAGAALHSLMREGIITGTDEELPDVTGIPYPRRFAVAINTLGHSPAKIEKYIESGLASDDVRNTTEAAAAYVQLLVHAPTQAAEITLAGEANVRGAYIRAHWHEHERTLRTGSPEEVGAVMQQMVDAAMQLEPVDVEGLVRDDITAALYYDGDRKDISDDAYPWEKYSKAFKSALGDLGYDKDLATANASGRFDKHAHHYYREALMSGLEGDAALNYASEYAARRVLSETPPVEWQGDVRLGAEGSPVGITTDELRREIFVQPEVDIVVGAGTDFIPVSYAEEYLESMWDDLEDGFHPVWDDNRKAFLFRSNTSGMPYLHADGTELYVKFSPETLGEYTKRSLEEARAKREDPWPRGKTRWIFEHTTAPPVRYFGAP